LRCLEGDRITAERRDVPPAAKAEASKKRDVAGGWLESGLISASAGTTEKVIVCLLSRKLERSQGS